MRALALAFALILTSVAALAQIGLPFPGPGTVHTSGAAAGPFVFKCSAHSDTTVFNTTTADVDCTGANVFFCVWSRYTGSGSLVAPSDNDSNTYTQVGSEQASASSTGVTLWRAFAASTSATHHWNSTSLSNPNFAALNCMGFSDGSTSAEDTTYTHAAANSPGAITPTGTNRLMVAGFVGADGDTGTPSISAGGYTIPTNGATPYAGGGPEPGAIAYKIQTSAASDNPTFATSGGGTGASIQQAFQ